MQKKIETTTVETTPVVSKNILVSVNASRISGVAPLSVFFDTSGTTALATSLPFHELEYQWNFGDNDTVTSGASPDSDHCSFYNNTFYTNAAGTFNYTAIQIGGTANNTIMNNLAYAPNTSGSKVVLSVSGTTVTASNNTGNFGGITVNPSFISDMPLTPVDFKTTGNYSIGNGLVVPVWSDFFGSPQTSTRDIGAVLH